MKFKEFIMEKLDKEDYTASAEKDKFSKGYRVLVKNKQGRASYLSQVAYVKEQDAIDAAQIYIDIMVVSPSERRLNDAMHEFQKSHKIAKDGE